MASLIPDQVRDNSVERRKLLLEAATAIDQGQTKLAPGQAVRETAEGALARALAEDTASFAEYPVWHRITDQDFISRGLSVPVPFSELTQRFKFFWMYAPIALFPQRDWGFNRLDVIMQFNPAAQRPGLRPKAYQILPAKQFQQLLIASQGLDVRLDENFQFSASVKPNPVDTPVGGAGVGAGVDARAAGSVGLVVGPFTYRIKRAKIDHTPVGMEMVRWRIDGAEFFQEDSPELIVVLQVPQETDHVDVVAALEARRYFGYGAAGLRAAVKQLAASVRRFFQDGMPLTQQVTWRFPTGD